MSNSMPMSSSQRAWLAGLLAMGALALSACGDKTGNESAGQKVDAAIAKTEQAADTAKAKTEAMASDAKAKMESSASDATACVCTVLKLPSSIDCHRECAASNSLFRWSCQFVRAVSSAVSSSLTKSPLPPISASDPVESWSPLVRISTTWISTPGICAASRPLTIAACASASLLGREPILILCLGLAAISVKVAALNDSPVKRFPCLG